MISTVQVGGSLGLSKGQHRTVFRNPRGNKRYISFYLDPIYTIRSEYSNDGVTWSGTQSTAITFVSPGGECHAFDVKIYDDGSQLEVWVVAIGYDDTAGEVQTKYRYGTITDATHGISWGGAVQVIDAAINDEGLGEPHCIALARTDNGRIVVAFTENYTTMGKDYRQIKLIGSDGDGASPSWSGETVWDDPSVNTNNKDKVEVWFGLESYSFNIASGNGFHILAREPEPTNETNYRVSWDSASWNGTVFSTSPVNLTGGYTNSGKVLSLLIDEADYAHAIYWSEGSGDLRSNKATLPGGKAVTGGVAVTTSDVDACTLALDLKGGIDVATSTEYNDWGLSGCVTAHQCVDEYPPDDSTTHLRTGSNGRVFRLGGFEGGIAPVNFRMMKVSTGGTVDIWTYKDGIQVEQLADSFNLVQITWTTHTFTPTDPDWNEIRVRRRSGNDDIRCSSVWVDPGEAYIFYHKSADSVEWNYKTSPVDVISWSEEQTIFFDNHVVALSSWNRVVENEIHVGIKASTAVYFLTWMGGRTLPTTLADLTFPTHKNYIGPLGT